MPIFVWWQSRFSGCWHAFEIFEPEHHAGDIARRSACGYDRAFCVERNFEHFAAGECLACRRNVAARSRRETGKALVGDLLK